MLEWPPFWRIKSRKRPRSRIYSWTKSTENPVFMRLLRLWCYYNTSIHSSDNAGSFHISFSFSVADKAPLCKGGWQKSLISDWGIVLYRCPTIPPSRLTPCHLPLHKGGFSPYNNFTNYAVSICKRQEIIPQNIFFDFAAQA